MTITSRGTRVACGALTLALAASCGEPAPAPRSVLVVVVDSLHAEHVSAHGYERPTTPFFDRFAAEGVRFENASSQSSWTLPSTASLFTGLDQESHGVRTFDDRLATSTPSIAESFRAAGYRTAAIVQTPVLSSRHGLGRGFDRYRVLDHSLESARRALELAREEWLRDGRQPVFLYLHLAPPHMPYQPPAPFAGRYLPLDASAIRGTIEECRRAHRARLAPDHQDVRALAARYDEHVSFADQLAGSLLADLRAAPRTSRALIVWTSDHGEAFLQHGSQGHNATVFEEMIHVPLALGAPDGTLAPRVIAEPVSTLDLAPTLLEACGLPPLGAELDGASMWSALTAREPLQERWLFASSRYKDDASQLHVSARRGRFKLVSQDGQRALYDLEDDPGETRDVSTQHVETALELGRAMQRWLDDTRSAERAPPPSDSREATRRLAELGYAADER